MAAFMNERSIGPDTEDYQLIEAARKAIGKEVKRFLGDEALPLKAHNELRFGARCELYGGDSFSYTFAIGTSDEKAIARLFESGDANTIALSLFDIVTRHVELDPSALIRIQLNSWEWLKARGISSQTYCRNGDERYDHQLFVDAKRRLYSALQAVEVGA